MKLQLNNLMAFYSDEQRKESGSKFFTWEDGKIQKLKVKNVSEKRFSDGKWELKMNITDVESGQVWEDVKYQFDFANALDKVEELIDENTVLEVTATKTGTKPNSKNPEKPYDVFRFDIKVLSSGGKTEEAPF